MNKNIAIKITEKEYQLLKFIREELPYGKAELVIHKAQPEKVIIREIERRFDVKIEGLDKLVGDRIQ